MRLSKPTTGGRDEEIVVQICLLSGLLATVLALAAAVAH